jgi:hypothetical protein
VSTNLADAHALWERRGGVDDGLQERLIGATRSEPRAVQMLVKHLK